MNPQELAAFKPETPGELPLRWVVLVYADAGEGWQAEVETVPVYAERDVDAVSDALEASQVAMPPTGERPVTAWELEPSGTLRPLPIPGWH